MGRALQEKFKDLLYQKIFPQAGLFLVKLISATYRLRMVDTDNEKDALAEYGSVVYTSWHQRFFPGITFFASRKPIAIMISQSRDGEMIARVVDVLGWHAIRGSSTRGGKQALKEARMLARKGYRIGHIVDGPQGPFGVIKPGLLAISQFSGAPILPVITSARRYWMFNSWDRFIVPKPFSHVIIRFGAPIFVPRHLDTDAFEAFRLDVEEKMRALYQETDAWWKSPEKIPAS
ncbi:lysophospholipid acyltransferase family protein [Desulfosarcina sp. OttesenSCG-928-A07]|nr:lysophospholipid acyltransferase family protein [Desulfosarcina sp. OttesenSCG-928-G17]MDL2328409.1 lysophospholipid acyltransferase family protein [Desulfosarcina sp. OttesenSCG-928-A07]